MKKVLIGLMIGILGVMEGKGQENTWVRSIAIAPYNYASTIHALSNDKFRITGTCGGESMGSGPCFITIDTNCTLLHSAMFTENDYTYIQNHHAILLPDSGYVVVGSKKDNQPTEYDPFIVKYDKDLTKEWEHRLSGNGWGTFKKVILFNNQILACGYVTDTLTGFKRGLSQRFSLNGTVEDTLIYGEYSEFTDLAAITPSCLLLLGTRYYPNQESDVLIECYDNNFEKKWTNVHHRKKFDFCLAATKRTTNDVVFLLSANDAFADAVNDSSDSRLFKIDTLGNVSELNLVLVPTYFPSFIKETPLSQLVIGGKYATDGYNAVEGFFFLGDNFGNYVVSTTQGGNEAIQENKDIHLSANVYRNYIVGNNAKSEPRLHNIMVYKVTDYGFYNIQNSEEIVSARLITQPSPIIFYPNPSQGNAFLRLSPCDANIRIELTDLRGKNVFIPPSYGCELDIRSLASGVYVLSLFSKASPYPACYRLVVEQ